MEGKKVLNFDIFIIAIVLMCVASGLYRGFFKQLSTTISLAGAFAVVYFVKPMLMDMIESMAIYETITGYIFMVLRFVAKGTQDEIGSHVVFILLFVVSFFVIRMVFNVFSPSRKNVVLKTLTRTSRIIGGVLGVVSGYAIIMLTLILIKPITTVDYTTPITEIVISFNQPLQNELGADYFDQIS